jgi:hypothetical protein
MRDLLEVWQDSSKLPPDHNEIRIELAREIATLTESHEWKPTLTDIEELREAHSALQQEEETLSLSGPLAVVSDQIEKLEKQNQWLTWRDRVWKTAAIHGVFWITLIFAYPRFAWVQAIFFWNPWVRRLLGLGYVGVALAWVPFLRHRLFAPFGRSLLADAELAGTQQESYFPRSHVRKRTGNLVGEPQPVKDAIPELKGQIVLQGASGLGKTKFLQHMLAGTSRITVFLRADRCTKGVMPAIQAKLKGSASDEKYLTKLIHAGAIDICIDGLNEVSAETRAKIIHFTEDQFSGNIILTTQPIEWTPPATATIFELQPLDADQIEDFLTTREIPADADVTLEKYQSRCRGFLRSTIPKSKDDALTNSAKRILSNPMDLTIVSQMLARDQKPNLLRLQQQQFDSMAEDYQTTQKKPFPLETFSQAVYEMRLADQSDLPTSQFAAETECMHKHRMVVRREIPDLNDESKPAVVWRFRHDKVMEFFIVQSFLENHELQSSHFSDERFRGVYFLLANLLPKDKAKALREKLIQHAAETKDHNVSDEFVILFNDREELDRLPEQPDDETSAD